ncbi:hypothetical protein GH714_019941 [Hevea brasiliensis]|uniref:OBG-type G domain-containing protein n=1 Tax=Hevea brasiliensis TaxID=3981 RepID=A0A6A6K694_HEVBR|nr:hypothetical protein GH714_019941 [Hevea brasiliensis]
MRKLGCCFWTSQGVAMSPNVYILASVLRASTQLDGGCGPVGKLMHGFIFKLGFDQDVFLGTSLVDFYAKNGDIVEARMIFDALLEKSTITWTKIITGYVRSGRSEVALQLFNQMGENDIVLDRYVLSSVLSACSTLKFVEGGKQIHAYVLRRGIEMDVSVVNVLIDFYAKSSKVQTARKLFDQMVDRDVISWTTMIAGYMQNSFDGEAVMLFVEMTRLGGKPDGFACTSILTSCGSLEALMLGRQIHAYSIKANLEFDIFLKNGLIDMYAKCDSLNDARRVFDVMTNHNVVSYNALIEGYSRSEQLSDVIILFHEMRHRMIPPSLLTFVSLLGVSAALSSLELSKQIHALTFKFGVCLAIFAGSALIDAYSKCLRLVDARLVFDEMNEKDIVVWNAMFSGYTQQSENEEALKLYSELQVSELKPNDFTFATFITAASNLASLLLGQQFHNHIIKMGLDFDPFITNSLIHMYAKCGSFEDACKAFGSAIWRDVACWNSLILTYAHHGEAKEALQMFEGMMEEGIKPNYVTFVSLLSACSHAGLVEDGLRYFKSMPKFCGHPGIEHYSCVVSLLCRAGMLYEAKEFIEKMPIKPTAAMWRSLLSASRIAGNIELSKYAAEKAISVDPNDSGSYTLLSNMFASKGKWVDVKQAKLAKLRRELLEPSSKGGGGGGQGFDVTKSGDARVGLVGFPSVGKSTLLNKLTGTFSEVASYEFTTLTCIPGVIMYRGAKIQLLDLPGIIEGAKDGKGQGRQVIHTARTCNCILIVLDAIKLITHKRLIEKELEGFGIRLNKEPPNISFRKKDKGGINFVSTVTNTHLDLETVKAICSEYRIHNADITLKYDATADDLIDVIEGSRNGYICPASM